MIKYFLIFFVYSIVEFLINLTMGIFSMKRKIEGSDENLEPKEQEKKFSLEEKKESYYNAPHILDHTN